MMADDGGRQGTLRSMLRWKGLLAQTNRTLRAMVLVVLATAAVALAFTQLGFVGIELPGGHTAHLVVLLQPVALAALLFGPMTGGLMGLFAGGVLYFHAMVMPLDFYEQLFVTPFSSIVMLAVTGLVAGLLFALGLRQDPPWPRRFVAIGVGCVVCSAFYSFGFVAGQLGALARWLVQSGPLGAVSQEEVGAFMRNEAYVISTRLGDSTLQFVADALLMVGMCALGDKAAGRARRLQGDMRVHALFNAWLAAVVLLAFMVSAVVAFVAISSELYVGAEDYMKSEVGYLCNQLDDADRKQNALDEFFKSLGLTDDEILEGNLDDLIDAISTDGLLAGYDAEEDGIVAITYGLDLVQLTDLPNYEYGDTLEGLLGSEVVAAAKLSAETGETQRIVYDQDYKRSSDKNGWADRIAHSEVAYLYAQKAGLATVVGIAPEHMVFEERSMVLLWTMGFSSVLLAAVFAMVSRLLTEVVVRRIDDTNGVLARITGGDLDARVDVRDTHEFRSLSDGINHTVDAMKGWIAEAESRMDAELATAKAIQEAAIPRIFPPYPDNMHFDLYASMNAARQVGGDFYDFFLIGEDAGPDAGKLGFVVADVSGKGIPAALFMMAAKSQIRSYMESGMELGEAIENANHQLCDGNDANMFVTVFAGVLDYATGHVDYVSAGHNPPLLWHDGTWQWLRKRSGLPLGIFDGMTYRARAIDCAIGDQFVIYTDGVTEAMDVNDVQYGERRLEEIVNENYTQHPRGMVDAVRRDVARHAHGAEQSDDITILALEVGVPPEITATLEVPARLDQLARVSEFIHTELDHRLCPLRAQNQLDVAVEEMFVNVCHYAYPDATPENPGIVRVSYTYSADPPSIQVDIVDEGIPFDPLAKPDAVVPTELSQVTIGGLGILMAKRSVNEMRYERVDGSNVVSLVKKW